MAFALPHLSLDKLAKVMPTMPESSVSETLRCTNNKSKLTLSVNSTVGPEYDYISIIVYVLSFINNYILHFDNYVIIVLFNHIQRKALL